MKIPKLKTKKKSAPKKNSKQQLSESVLKISKLFTEHAVVIMFIVGGATIGVALLRARSYLDPVRDETRYQEASSKNTYGKIDYKLVQRLQESLNDASINVNKILAPGRSNPFNE